MVEENQIGIGIALNVIVSWRLYLYNYCFIINFVILLFSILEYLECFNIYFLYIYLKIDNKGWSIIVKYI